MPDLVWPIDIIPSRVRWGFVDSTARSDSPTTGVTRTSSLYGTRRWKATLEFDNLNAARRHRVLAFLAAAKQANRVWVPDLSTVRRGAMSAPELLTNADFSQGVTGWSIAGATLSAAGGGLRAKRLRAALGIEVFQSVSLPVQYGAFALRSVSIAPQWPTGNLIGPAISDSVQQVTDYSTARGLRTASLVALSTTAANNFPIAADALNAMPGAYVEIPYASLARCFLVDNGPNAFLQSDAFNTGWTLNAATVTADSIAAPDGNTTADALIENTATDAHYASRTMVVPSSAADFTVCCAFKAGDRTWSWLQLSDAVATSAQAWFNLSAGTLGNVTVSGSGFTNARAFIESMGDGWYFCSLVARKTGSFTTLHGRVGVANANGALSYTGATLGLYPWRATLAQSSTPVRLTQTTTTATTGTAQTGSAIHVKGGPANTNGALAAGDMVEIILPTYSHFARLTADLDFDAAGLGYMQFEPGLPTGVSDNAAIIVEKPMCRMIPVDSFEWDTRPGLFSDFSVSFVQAT